MRRDGYRKNYSDRGWRAFETENSSRKGGHISGTTKSSSETVIHLSYSTKRGERLDGKF